MAKIGTKSTEQLEIIKRNVKQSHDYFKKNYERFHYFMKFIYFDSMSSAEINTLQDIQIPQLQFNILEAYISRLEGEFMDLDPAFSVRPADGVVLSNPLMIDVVEGHLKAAFMSPDKDGLSQKFYRDILSGGYSVGKVWTDYKASNSFDQDIFVDRVFDPTLTGFDPLARLSHKGDGRYAYELFPKSEQEAKDLFGNDIVKDMNFDRNFSEFNWSYRSQNENIVLFAEYFNKKMKRVKLLKLTGGYAVVESEYENFLKQWEASGVILQAPQVINSRMTDIETIERFTVCQNKVVDYKATDYSFLPLVFIDGKSVILRENEQSEAKQVTRPYVYQAKDIQRLRNYAGQRLACEIENMIMHKWIAPVEGIPDNADYQIAYEDMQHATTVLYNAFHDNDPNKPLPPPREVVRTPIPPEISNTFMMTEKMCQLALGSYDAAQGQNRNDMSGIALLRGAINSNQAAKPYTKGFIEGWNRLGQIYLDLLPKYFVTPRTIPVVSRTGERGYVEINKPGKVRFNYDVKTLEIKVEAGVNFEVQKQIALDTIVQLMKSSEVFNAFINQKGLEVIIGNLDIHGVETLKILAKEFMDEMKQQQAAQAQAQQNTPTPQQLEIEKLNLEKQKEQNRSNEAQVNSAIAAQKVSADDAVKNKQIDVDLIKTMAQISGQIDDRSLQQEKTDAENARTAVDMAINLSENNRISQKHEKEMSESKDTELPT